MARERLRVAALWTLVPAAGGIRAISKAGGVGESVLLSVFYGIGVFGERLGGAAWILPIRRAPPPGVVFPVQQHVECSSHVRLSAMGYLPSRQTTVGAGNAK